MQVKLPNLYCGKCKVLGKATTSCYAQQMVQGRSLLHLRTAKACLYLAHATFMMRMAVTGSCSSRLSCTNLRFWHLMEHVPSRYRLIVVETVLMPLGFTVQDLACQSQAAFWHARSQKNIPAAQGHSSLAPGSAHATQGLPSGNALLRRS